MRGKERLPLPMAADSKNWMTVSAQRTVLGIVHNITSATRLLDLLAVFAGDTRVQTIFTCTGSSALDGGTRRFLRSQGMLHIPWEEAKARSFDVAIATNRGGDLHNLRTPLIGTPHGAGYNKYLPGAGSREPGAGSREPGAFGLSPEWLMHDGHVVPAVIVLSHEEQRARLAASCPEAVSRAVVAGDPCYDQLLAGMPFREQYRRALGIRPGQNLVVVSSTWGEGSILASDGPDIEVLRRAMAEFPLDEYRILAAVHPNAWYGHGRWQWQEWLTPLVEHGMLLPAPETNVWKAALVAADGVIGDHGSLSLYGVSLGIPSVLGSFADAKVAADSPMARLGEILPRLSADRPLMAQFEAAADQPDSAALLRLRETVSSRPRESAALLRSLFYGRLDLPEPAYPATTSVVPAPALEPATGPSPVSRAVFVSVAWDGAHARVRRYPAALQRRTQERHLAGTHLVADTDDPDTVWPRSADVLLVPLERPSHAAGPDGWKDILARFPGCALLTVEEPSDGALAVLSNGGRLRATWRGPQPWWTSAALAASVVYERLAAGDTGPASIPVSVGPGTEVCVLDISPV